MLSDFRAKMEKEEDKTHSGSSSTDESNDDGFGDSCKFDSPDQSSSSSVVKKKLKNISFGRAKKKANFKTREGSKKKKSSSWSLVRLCARTDSCISVASEMGAVSSSSCICTAYRRTTDSSNGDLQDCSIELTKPEHETCDHCATKDLETQVIPTSSTTERRLRIPESPSTSHIESRGAVSTISGLSELALTFASRISLNSGPVPQYPYLARWGTGADPTHFTITRLCPEAAPAIIHTQVDYTHHLVPDILGITNFGYYWGKMDRYEAEKLLDNKPEGTFLLRDSAQDEHLFSVSFRRFDRSLHARIEQWNDRFSFDSHDPGVFSSSTVSGLVEHYKDPSHCMFFEPMLTIPLHRTFPFSLQHLARATLCPLLTYDSINQLNLPKKIKSFLKEYHYKKQVRVRRFEPDTH